MICFTISYIDRIKILKQLKLNILNIYIYILNKYAKHILIKNTISLFS